MEPIVKLEEQMTHLEQHVAEQDKVIFKMGQEIANLQRAIQKLHATLEEKSTGSGSVLPSDEKPPHY